MSPKNIVSMGQLQQRPGVTGQVASANARQKFIPTNASRPMTGVNRTQNPQQIDRILSAKPPRVGRL